MNKKIRQALGEEKLVDFDKLFASYSKKRQQKILKKAKCLKAAMAVRKLRKRLNLSQEKLAEKMTVDREFISRIESGRKILP